MSNNEKDMENGDPKRDRISFADGWDPDVSLQTMPRHRQSLTPQTEG